MLSLSHFQYPVAMDLWVLGTHGPVAVVFGAGDKQFGGWVGVSSLCDQKMRCFLNATPSLGVKGESFRMTGRSWFSFVIDLFSQLCKTFCLCAACMLLWCSHLSSLLSCFVAHIPWLFLFQRPRAFFRTYWFSNQSNLSVSSSVLLRLTLYRSPAETQLCTDSFISWSLYPSAWRGIMNCKSGNNVVPKG